jgi:hypothetical protein
VLEVGEVLLPPVRTLILSDDIISHTFPRTVQVACRRKLLPSEGMPELLRQLVSIYRILQQAQCQEKGSGH